jgi:two-component system, LytTR family, sensor kinase
MTPSSATALFHVLGFLTASALYVMLAAMTLGGRSEARERENQSARRSDLIPLGTALLGLIWNVGELVMYGLHVREAVVPAWFVVVAFAALFYLPAVVVHSALAGASAVRSGTRQPNASQLLVAAAYGLSTIATVLNIAAATRGELLPSRESLLVLSVGFVAVVALLTVYSRRQPTWRRALPAAAVATFAVMLLHLTRHSGASDEWVTELVGHHGSLFVVLVILYQDYRFALADLFLKRAITLLAVTVLAAALYAAVVVPFVIPHLAAGPDGHTTDPLAAAALVALWVGTALAYPRLRRVVTRFVDRTVLGRPETSQLIAYLSAATATLTRVDDVLEAVCQALARALSATRSGWVADPASEASSSVGATARALVSVTPGARETTVRVVVADPPGYRITIGGLSGGRRLMSDDFALLEGVARLAARRIDALRVADERYERDVREQQIRRLATEAELRALRAQLNPHFLFNALTTIGYLVREAPDRALDTLFRLTDVLRAVLKRSDGEFTTLGDEMDIVSAYLAIERARFEDRLRVTTDVAPELSALRIPPLVLQPVVENAVKHGIASLVRGGRIIISARIEDADVLSDGNGTVADDRRQLLCLTVTDTGLGTTPAELASRRRVGIGLANLERRLERYFGDAASLDVRSAVGVGTTVDIRFPATVRDPAGVLA